MKRQPIKITNIDKGQRARKEYGNINELLQSIKKRGLMHDIVLFDKEAAEDWQEHELINEEEDSEARYYLIAGGRRLTAWEQGDLGETIPAKVYDEHLTREEIKLKELEENIEREDLSYKEETFLTYDIHRKYQDIHGEMEGHGKGKTGHSIRDTANALGKSAQIVSEDVRLAKAMDTVPELFDGAKNKTEAKKVLKDATKQIEEEEKAQKIREERSNTKEGKIQAGIAEKYITVDILEGMKRQETQSIGFVELDPPLEIGFEDIYKDDQSYNASLNEENYLNEMEKVLKESYRIMKQHSWILVWYPIEPFHQPLWKLMNDVGFKTRAIPLLWDKQAGQTRAGNYNLANCYEVALYGRKGDITLNKPARNNIFNFKRPSKKKRIHKTEKPIELYEEILQTFCRKGTTICSGYAGSGNVILAAENSDMTAFGFDTSESMKDKFDLKVYDDLPPDYSSY